MLPKNCENSQQDCKTLNPTHIPREQKTASRKDEAWDGSTCAYCPTINHQHSPSLQDGGSLHKHENFEECPQTIIGNLRNQTY